MPNAAKGWTPARRAQHRKAIHTWRPWTHSTGPRTLAGKPAVARNAFKGAVRPRLRVEMRHLRALLAKLGEFV